MSNSLIAIVYVDNILVYGRRNKDITKLIEQLQKRRLLSIVKVQQRDILALIYNRRAANLPSCKKA
jgi:hypothetical protein